MTRSPRRAASRAVAAAALAASWVASVAASIAASVVTSVAASGVVPLVAAALVPTAAFAHHGWSDYDADHPMTLKGRIETSSYENPHATITMAVDGKTWQIVLAPVSRMESRGAPREAVAVGRDVTVVGYPSRSHPGEMRAERIVVGDGASAKTVELR